MSLPMPHFQPDSEGEPPPVGPDSGEERGEISDEDDRHAEPDEIEEATDEQDAELENELSGDEDLAETGSERIDLDETEESEDTPDDDIDEDLAGEAETGTNEDEKTDSEPGDEMDTEDGSDEAIAHDSEDTSNESVERDLVAGEESEEHADENIDYDPSETVDLGEYDWQHTTVVQPQKPPPMEVRIQEADGAGISHDSGVPGSIPDYLAEKNSETGVDENPAPSELTASKAAGQGGWLRWAILGALIVILLVWVHQARGMLARNSLLRPALTGFYSAIGIDLKPVWDIAQYAILSSTASEARGGDLVVTVTYTNLAEFPQPYPTLKVVLEDRWGESLDVRYFEPNEYLAGFVAARAMRAGESATGETAIPSTGANAVGFSIDVCLTPETGDITCASDL